MEHSTKLSDSLLAGAASGLVSRMLVSPLDVIKIRWQNSTSHRDIQLSKTVRNIVQSPQGYAGLFRGNTWGIAIWILYGAIQFPAYEVAKDALSPTWLGKSQNHFIAGSVAASFATLFTFPLDAMRTRIITSNQHHSRNLARGLQPALVAIVPMAGLTFALHETLVKVTHEPASSGMLAGMLSKTVFYPLDTVKRRLMTQGMVHAESGAVLPSYSSQWECAKSIYVQEGGFRAFFRGLSPAMVKTGLGSGCTFFVYEITLKYLNSIRQQYTIEVYFCFSSFPHKSCQTRSLL